MSAEPPSPSNSRQTAVPGLSFVYGTAWKEDATEALTELAISCGFRGIDTANQRKHYYEAGVGAGIQAAIERGEVQREDLFLQTKFTFRAGQDQRLPYDPAAPIGDQVRQSFARSLEHLGTEWIDSYVLHGPSVRLGLGPDDWDAWRAMEGICESGQARGLGISNVSLEQLQQLCGQAKVNPTFVQNRCYAVTGWDYHVRQFCRAQGITYQGFSLLTANVPVLSLPVVTDLAQRHGCRPEQVIFRFAIDVGMLPLTGTTSAEHMHADLAVSRFELAAEDVAAIERVALR